MKKLKVALIGAGLRGQAYTDFMTDDRFQVVAVAEPIEERREYIRKLHNVPEEMCFDTWEKVTELPKCADLAIVSTMDRMHYEPAMQLIEKKYNLLLEKPIAPVWEECRKIEKAAKENRVKILVCHVLRYTPFFGKMKEMIDQGAIGRVMSIHHSECVGNRHQSHSFVRGNWGNEKESSFMLLQKSCHDMDIIQWLVGEKCVRAQSFGSLTYFVPENAPEGAPEYCIEGCPKAEECYYNAVKLYLEDEKNLWFREAAAKVKEPTNQQIEEILRSTQYGKCVFKCNNDVVDHQVVNLEFEGGAVASFNMCAFNEGGRFIRVMGTDGELSGDMKNKTIDYYDFCSGKHELIDTEKIENSGKVMEGHGGGDLGIVNVLYQYLTEGYEGDLLSEIEISAQNHMIAFAAERSRLENRVVDLSEFEV